MRLAPHHVPVLTEVIEPQAPPSLPASAVPGSPPPLAIAVPAVLSTPSQHLQPTPDVDVHGAITQRVLAAMQAQIDAALEQRLHAALAPALEQFAHALVRDSRVQLAAAMGELVSQAVADELARLRSR